MREQAISLLGTSIDEFVETRRQSVGFPAVLDNQRQFKPQEKRNSTNFVSVSVFEEGSMGSSSANVKTNIMARRHKSID